MSDVSNPEFNNPKKLSTDSSVDHAPLPHSGDAGIEFPVNEFDKTPLHQAVSEGLITTPDDPSSIAGNNIPANEQIGVEAKKRHGKLFIGASTLLAAGLGFAGLSMTGNNKSKDIAPAEDTVTTSPTTLEVQTTPEELAVKYPNLSVKEARLLNTLVKYGYVDKVKAYYNYDGTNSRQLIIDLATDVAAVTNTHNFDSFAQMYGYKEFEGEFKDTLFPNNNFNLDKLAGFYAPYIKNTKFKPCTYNGDSVECEGYVEMMVFWRREDADSDYVKDIISNRLANQPPDNSAPIYLIINAKINPELYIVEHLTANFSYDEPNPNYYETTTNID